MSKGGGILDAITKPFEDIGTLITHPSIKNLENVGHDLLPVAETIGATAIGAPYLGAYALPAAAAGVSGVNTAVRGGGLGKSLLSAAEGGALAYGGQQLAGAAGAAFPETSAAISNAIPDLGINSTIDSVRGALPNLGIGDTLSSAANSVGNALGISDTASTSPGIGTSPTGTPSNTPITGGTGASATATPGGLGSLSGDVSQQDLFPTSIGGGGTSGGGSFGIPSGSQDLFPSSVDTGTPSGSFLESQPGTGATAPGGANVGTQQLGSAVSGEPQVGGNTVNSNLGANPFSSNTGNTSIDNLVNSFASEQAAAAPVNDILSPAVISASNAATLGGTDFSLNQPGFFSNIFGSSDGVAQTTGSVAGAAVPSVGGQQVAQSAQPSSLSEIFDKPGSIQGYEDLITRNPGILLSGGLGLAGMAKQAGAYGNTTPQGQNQIKQIASQENAQGQQLAGYLQSGKLPPGLQTNINQQSNAAKAAIRSRYASMGMSGSSSEQQDLANVDAQAQARSAEIAMQLLTTGINETGMAAGLYTQMMNDSLQKDAGLSKSISDFAAAMAGGVVHDNQGHLSG